jgi:cytochrome c
MLRLGRSATLGGVIAGTALSAAAHEGDISAGHALVSAACKACYVVDPEEKSPRILAIAPAFREIANAPGMTATALRVFLSSSHPKMPNLILPPQQTAGVMAYILSLRDRP